jgi:hypothetical protein
MMEISLDTTDDPQINIAEIYDSDAYQRRRENGSKGERDRDGLTEPCSRTSFTMVACILFKKI